MLTQFWLLCALLIATCFVVKTQSWTFKSTKPTKIAAALCISAGVTLGGNSIPANAAGNPALEAATRAMTEKKEKAVLDRDFSDLPDAAKKRRALKACKESPKEGGYRNTATCNEAVISGDYGIIMGGGSKPVANSIASPISSTSSVDIVKPPGPQVDLSNLSPAALKRRSLAACKKPDVRKFAKLGSESKCTESVMKGDYSRVLSALEKGF